MKTVKRWSGTRFSRHLVAAAIMFVVMFLYRKLVLALFPSLDTWFIAPLIAGGAAGAIWYLAFRGQASR